MAPYKRNPIDVTPTVPVQALAMPPLVGRPSTYEPAYCQRVIADALEGDSLGGFAGRLGIARGTVNDWMNKYPAFAEACAQAKSIGQAAWEARGIDIGKTGGAGGSQATMVIHALNNLGREDWKNRQDVDVSGTITLASIVEASMKTIEAKVIESESVELAPPSVEDLF